MLKQSKKKLVCLNTCPRGRQFYITKDWTGKLLFQQLVTHNDWCLPKKGFMAKEEPTICPNNVLGSQEETSILSSNTVQTCKHVSGRIMLKIYFFYAGVICILCKVDKLMRMKKYLPICQLHFSLLAKWSQGNLRIITRET